MQAPFVPRPLARWSLVDRPGVETAMYECFKAQFIYFEGFAGFSEETSSSYDPALDPLVPKGKL